MKIVRLSAENVKRLRAVEITPTGALVEITGRNGQGKTSVLDSIWWALAGQKNIQAVPIRKGENKARIRLDLGELVVERRFTESTSTLTIENAEGARFSSPQGIADALFGALTFDPLAFVSQKPAEQFDTLRRVSNVEVDFDALDALNAGDYARRTDINREAKMLRAQVEGIVVPAGLPAERIDTKTLLDEMASASKVNAEIETRRARREEAAKASALERERAAEALRLAADLTATADARDKKLAEAPALPKPVDVDAIRARIAATEAINAGFEAVDRKKDLEARAAAKEAEAAKITEAMEARAAAKADAIAKAKLPVDGLGFGDKTVTFNGLPFDQASDAEQIRVSLSIAMAANPTLRVIRIKQGSTLDDDGMKMVAKMAEERDFQIWIERVSSDDRMGVFIEDGMVKRDASTLASLSKKK